MENTIRPNAIIGFNLNGRFRISNYLKSILIFNITAIVLVISLVLLTRLTDTLVLFRVIFPLIVLLYLFFNLRASILRLHDLNRTGWFVLLAFVPVVNIIFALYLLFGNSVNTNNKYGAQTTPSSSLSIIILFVIYIIVATPVAMRATTYKQSQTYQSVR